MKALSSLFGLVRWPTVQADTSELLVANALWKRGINRSANDGNRIPELCSEPVQFLLDDSRSKRQIVHWCMPELRRRRLCTAKSARYSELDYRRQWAGRRCDWHEKALRATSCRIST